MTQHVSGDPRKRAAAIVTAMGGQMPYDEMEDALNRMTEERRQDAVAQIQRIAALAAQNNWDMAELRRTILMAVEVWNMQSFLYGLGTK